MSQIFKILETGNVYLPLKDIGKAFIVKDTITFPLSKSKEIIKITETDNLLFLNMIFRYFWEDIKKDKKFLKENKDCWLCPSRIENFMGQLEVTFDILKPVRKRSK